MKILKNVSDDPEDYFLFFGFLNVFELFFPFEPFEFELYKGKVFC